MTRFDTEASTAATPKYREQPTDVWLTHGADEKCCGMQQPYLQDWRPSQYSQLTDLQARHYNLMVLHCEYHL